MTDSSSEMTPQEKIIQERVNQSRKFLNLNGFAAGVLLIQCSMPSAVLNYLVASIYSPKKIIDSVASTIVVSTLMSFLTIPIVVFFALKYFN